MTKNEQVAIVDLTNLKVGQQVDGFFVVRSAVSGMATNNKAFLTLKLLTKSGEVEGKIWSVTDNQRELCIEGEIIKVRATVNEYKGNMQFNITLVRAVTESDSITLEELVPTSPVVKEEVEKEIIETILAFENAEMRELTLKIFSKHREQFLIHVAAKSMHHNLVSGLAYHTISMLHLAKSIAPIYPALNKDLLYAGVICHDIGKVRELDDIIAPKYTIEGSLLGHISIMISEVQESANELIREGIISKESLVPTLLSHLVASHHGKLEYGSPVEAKTIEAELLHHIDMIDSRMYMIGNALQGGTKGEFVRVQGMRRDFLVHQ